MSRIKRGWGLTKKSWGLLNEHRELIRFPLYGAVATILPAILFLGPGASTCSTRTRSPGRSRCW